MPATPAQRYFRRGRPAKIKHWRTAMWSSACTSAKRLKYGSHPSLTSDAAFCRGECPGRTKIMMPHNFRCLFESELLLPVMLGKVGAGQNPGTRGLQRLVGAEIDVRTSAVERIRKRSFFAFLTSACRSLTCASAATNSSMTGHRRAGGKMRLKVFAHFRRF